MLSTIYESGFLKSNAPSAKRKLVQTVQPTGREVSFSPDEFIVSKTDTTGHITYANDVFLRVASMTENEAIGAPHSVIRHPDMPRCVFKLLWSTISQGTEIFAYVKNLAKTGEHYWVLAHVTPSFNEAGSIMGYHSNRRAPSRTALEAIEPLYADLLKLEHSAGRKAGPSKGVAYLEALLSEKGVTYDQFVFSL